jgi:CRISPR/Cas system-associated exonuclease Cas4 (RecB family)
MPVLPADKKPRRPYTLYWSSLKMYEDCPQSFLWGRGWGDIDVGGGPGRRKPLPVKKSRHHALMGIVIQYALEKMYNDELWRCPPTELHQRLMALVEEGWDRQAAKSYNYVDYAQAGDRASLLEVCKSGVMGYLRTMRENRFLGPYAKAEVNLLGWVDKWNPVGGRPDVVIRRDDTGITILDGKNSKSKGEYTDPDQLRWYALLFYLSYKQHANRVGFIYYRYPHGTPILGADGKPTGEVETGVDWVPFTVDDLKGLAQRAVDARTGMNREKFGATPVPSNCKWCDYESVCPARQAQRSENAGKRAKKVEGLSESGGFVDLDL